MNLNVMSSPHIRGKFRTNRIMLDVVLALLPALLVGIGVFGTRALLVVLVTTASAILSEVLFCLVSRQKITVPDGSAGVTGVLLGMTLPHTVPFWQAIVGSVFAIVIV